MEMMARDSNSKKKGRSRTGRQEQKELMDSSGRRFCSFLVDQ
jgi:hypothetical protein